MAVTTIHPIKSTLKNALDYITDPQKTDGKKLPPIFDRYKFTKIGNNKTIKNMYKLDTICYNGVKL